MVDNTPRVLAGRYEVGELIGRGGMAEVHIGHDTRLGRTVAIKVLRSDLARDPSFLARFRREAQSAAALNHPAIVAVYDTGEDVHVDAATGGQVHIPFIVMEYVEGHTVRDILQGGAAVPIDEAVEITDGVLSALEYSHHAGIIHRDIKPANVMITPTGAVKVMDFGIARAVADSAASMTATHAVIGTAQYLSPEQARGEQVDARSDLYSTGCLLFELLTGRPPFVGDSPVAVAYQHVGQAPQAPSSLAPDVPAVLDRITMKALAKERAARYGSASEFRADLKAALVGGAVAAPIAAAPIVAPVAEQTVAFGAPVADATQLLPGGPTPQPWAPTTAPAFAPTVPEPVGPDPEEEAASRRRRNILIGVISAAVLVIIGLLVFLLTGGDDTPTAEMAEVPTIGADMTRDQARTLITEAGFLFVAEIDPESMEPEGTFVRQDPEGGTEAELGSVVTAYFSGGPDSFAMPDLARLTEAQARQTLEDLGLVVGDITEEPSIRTDAEAGQVIRTMPPTGNFMTAGDTVDLVISNGYTELTDLTGMTQADAEAELSRLDLTPRIVTVSNNAVTAGRVASQEPEANLVRHRQVVTINVAVPFVENIIGLQWDDFTVQRMCAQLDCQFVRRYDPARENSVIGLNLGVGTQQAPGTVVEITVSNGLEPEPTPPSSPTPTEPPPNGGDGGSP